MFSRKGMTMNSNNKFLAGAFALSMLLSIGGCDSMSRQDKHTAIGAGAGAVGGAVLTHGSAAGTLGGAAVGGVIGHEVNKHDND
jgi:osmotically inducible lipoprotein OsmB